MKKHHILIIIILAVCTAIIVSSTSSVSQYGDFAKASAFEGKEFTVVGNLNKEKPIDYNPVLNPNIVSFYMMDKKGKEFKVILNQSLPQDLDKSEEVVVKGKFRDDIFYAKTILLKCPSKYAEENKFNNPT